MQHTFIASKTLYIHKYCKHKLIYLYIHIKSFLNLNNAIFITDFIYKKLALVMDIINIRKSGLFCTGIYRHFIDIYIHNNISNYSEVTIE